MRLLVIDGSRDLISDINNQDQATALASWIGQLLDRHEVSIINILHKNKTSNDIRGAIGTEMLNKSTMILDMSRHESDKDVIVITSSELSRGEPLKEPVYMTRDERGLPLFVEEPETKSTSNRMTKDDMKSILGQIKLDNGEVIESQAKMIRLIKAIWDLDWKKPPIGKDAIIDFTIPTMIDRGLLKLKEIGQNKDYTII